MSGGILILVEHLKGELSQISYEMLGIGRKLAEASRAPLYAALLGSDVTALANRLGAADKVLLVEDSRLTMPPAGTVASLLKVLIEQQQVSLVLVGGTNITMGVGSMLSVRAHLPFVNFCREVRLENGAVVLTSQLFGGKIFSDVRLPDGRGIVSVYPGAFPADHDRSERASAVENVPVPIETSSVVFKRFIEPEVGDVDITKQNVLVAVGRGIQNEDNLALAEDLAAALGGVICASRPIIDQGWVPLSRQVGKSGMIVKPKLYLALGISGAPEHVEGMQGSQSIIAINTDAQAPIFDVAHYGVCGDLLEIVPVLTEKIKARKG
ncbi:MAG: electron transfer flavoprotein subunit alpha/FixB family protein [Verrucomicrobia bacterium]|nr:electron transfer flavoprotein subunit alpha/FixB family protein [Verrucomicrobiota bacterium]